MEPRPKRSARGLVVVVFVMVESERASGEWSGERERGDKDASRANMGGGRGGR
jgi:hypothetical protein